MFFTGRIGTLSPVTRTSMAYPLATKFRTGMAVAMFALVTFAIVYMSVSKNVVSQTFAQADTGGWQIVAYRQGGQAPTLPADLDADVRADSTLNNEVRAVGWENTVHYPLHVVDDGYLSATRLVLKHRAAGFFSDGEAWRAVRDKPGYAVVASFIDPGKVPSGPIFQPYQMDVVLYSNPPTSAPGTMTVTVVGVIDRTLWDGVYVSTRTAMSGGYFASQTAGSTLPMLSPTGYYFMVRPGVDIAKARLDLGRMLVKYDLEPILSADQAGPTMSFLLPLVNLVTGFLALGLIVGIAGLGVISTRAVVERLQQIGMLRALGYRRSLVQRSFLMETSLIAILGLVIGSVSGVWLSYRFFVVDKAFGPVRFDLPVAEIAGFLILAYLTTLVATYLPSRAASRIAPAAALRYE
jgi:putative ABC transport system permease protein